MTVIASLSLRQVFEIVCVHHFTYSHMRSYHVMRKGNFELMAIDFSNVSFYPSFISEPLLLKPRVREGVDTLLGYIYVDSSQYLSWFLPFEAMLRDAFLVHGCHLCLKAAILPIRVHQYYSDPRFTTKSTQIPYDIPLCSHPSRFNASTRTGAGVYIRTLNQYQGAGLG
ncbi:hypothetical protein HZ326_15330 [Fusarium oxysporum f. sp. albedinis]|nr:hypothetical protein HZ326_15330 [Fusarium oxysporum f. sp. albedinis]